MTTAKFRAAAYEQLTAWARCIACDRLPCRCAEERDEMSDNDVIRALFAQRGDKALREEMGR